MEIKKILEGEKLTLAIVGRLDTTTAPEFEAEVRTCLDGVKELVLDLEGTEYVSSAGLRVILLTQKLMNSRGNMVIKNVCETVKEVFDITGFSDVLTIL